MENPSLRVNGHRGSMNRTFIVEKYAENEFGEWTIDEETGEQGYIGDERSCFWKSGANGVSNFFFCLDMRHLRTMQCDMR